MLYLNENTRERVYIPKQQDQIKKKYFNKERLKSIADISFAIISTMAFALGVLELFKKSGLM